MASLQTNRHVQLLTAQIEDLNLPGTMGLFVGKQCTYPHIVPVRFRRENTKRPILGYAVEQWIDLNWRNNYWVELTDLCVEVKAGAAPDDPFPELTFVVFYEPQTYRSPRSENTYIRELTYGALTPFLGAVLVMVVDNQQQVVPFREEFIELAKRALLHVVYEHHNSTLSASSSPAM